MSLRNWRRKEDIRAMKRAICIAVMVFVGICVCACGKGGEEPVMSHAPESTAVTVSGQPVQEEGIPLVSSARAFAMAEDLVAGMTLKEKIGQMFMVHLSQLDSSHTEDGNQYKVTSRMRKLLEEYNFGGIYMTVNNIANEKQTKKLAGSLQNSVSGGALYLAIEEEGGGKSLLSSRIEAGEEDKLEKNPDTQDSDVPDYSLYQESYGIATAFHGVGININFAPVADVASEENPEYAARCLGSDTDTVADRAESFIRGMEAGGLATTLKYFPGIAKVAGNPALELLENNDSLMTLRSINFTTYEAGISAGADAVMMSNVSVNKVTINKIPAFLSQEIVTNLLREELGFDGVVFTPFLDEPLIIDKYTSGFVAVEAVKAGCDMLILPYDWREAYEALLLAVQRGDISEKVINTAVQRILKNKIQRGILIIENED